MRRDSGLPPGTLDMLILRVLASEPLHGYAIAQRIHVLSRKELSVEDGSLYPALQKLLRKGWVKAAPAISEMGRQVREYRITPSGRKRLEDLSDGLQRVSGNLSGLAHRVDGVSAGEQLVSGRELLPRLHEGGGHHPSSPVDGRQLDSCRRHAEHDRSRQLRDRGQRSRRPEARSDLLRNQRTPRDPMGRREHELPVREVAAAAHACAQLRRDERRRGQVSG